MDLAYTLKSSDMAAALEAAAEQARTETLPNYAKALRSAADWARLAGDEPEVQRRIAAAFFNEIERARDGATP